MPKFLLVSEAHHGNLGSDELAVFFVCQGPIESQRLSVLGEHRVSVEFLIVPFLFANLLKGVPDSALGHLS